MGKRNLGNQGNGRPELGRSHGAIMTDIQSPQWLYAKGALFLVLGILASGILLLDHPSLKVAGLLCLAVWSFARSYYFVFYVIEHYIDPNYKFSSLGSFVRYLIDQKRTGAARENLFHR
jgi:hypothetical protein